MLMADQDCGALPVFDGSLDGHVIGIITDRDIVCRAIADGLDPATARVDSCMSHPVVTVHEDDDLEKCSETLSKHGVRRVPVVNADGNCRGMVAQADIARHAETDSAGRLLQALSKPASSIPSRF